MLKEKRWQQMWPGTRLEIAQLCLPAAVCAFPPGVYHMCVERCEGKVRVLC